MCNLYFLKIHLAEESHCWHTLCKFIAPASLCSYCHNPFWSLPSPGPYQELPGSLSDYSDSSNPIAPNLFGPRDRFCETVSSPWVGRRGMVWGWFKCVTFIMPFISFIITSAPPQIIRHYILEAGNPCSNPSLTIMPGRPFYFYHSIWLCHSPA